MLTWEAKKNCGLMIERAEELNLAVAKLENDSNHNRCWGKCYGKFQSGEMYTKVCRGDWPMWAYPSPEIFQKHWPPCCEDKN